MSGNHQIQAARDRRTGFPVIRLRETDPFVALIPVTKLQAEQWIWQGGTSNQEDPITTTLLIERMEYIEGIQGASKYPPKVRKLIRAPISQCARDNLPGILATNLSLWNSPEEPLQSNVQYPTPTSEWGRLLRWLGAYAPKYKDWVKTLDSFARFRTKDLVRGVLQLNFSWAPVVESLLGKLLEVTSDEETGLPLMNLGVYELVSDIKKLDKVTEAPIQTIRRPIVAGESAIWPTLETSSEKWRAVLQPTLPVVTIRPWFEEGQVVDQKSGGRVNAFSAAAHPRETPLEQTNAPVAKSGKKTGSLNSYVTGRVTMSTRCPVCYSDVPPEIFYSDAGLWCYQESTKQTDSEVEDARSQIRKHSNERPPRVAGYYQVEAVHRDYLTVARKAPEKIRSICLSGFSESGKTVKLLSLWGLISYPQGKSRLPKSFPENWEFDLIKCSLLDFIRGATIVNIAKQTERMWIDGDLPVRTKALQRALRSPLLFKTKRRKWGVLTSQPQVILNFNDFPGELINKPTEFEKNENYPNVSSTTDVIFLAPAHQLDTAVEYLASFSAGLGAVKFDGKALDLKEINLILAISQIDRLRFSADPDEEQLLKILMQRPYSLPDKGRDDELMDYISKMEQAHFALQAWLKSNVPDLVRTAERYASVRYCGFSACGFQTVKDDNKPGVESWLPFEPQPVRIADPLLWLLRDNDVINF